jgi:hypothetical protein
MANRSVSDGEGFFCDKPSSSPEFCKELEGIRKAREVSGFVPAAIV